MRTLVAAVFVLGALAPGRAEATTFYLDPENGSMSGDGSAAAPWSTLQDVLDGNLVETMSWDALPYEPGRTLVVKNPGAPVKAGDTLRLLSGYHGSVEILGAYNTEEITIEAEPGHRPQVSSVLVRGAAGWIIRGLSISPEHAPVYEVGNIVAVESNAWNGPAHDVLVEGCEIFSVDDASAWSADDWNNLSANAVSVTGDHVTIAGNVIRNVDFGVSVTGQYALVEHNVIDGFAGDGLRGLGDYGVFQYNTVKNCYAVNDNHDDGFQSWSLGPGGEVGQGEVVGVVLRGNTIINYEDPAQPFRGTLQGIGCFDGFFTDWVIENNVILTDHWHGITLLGARRARIVNNTVIDLNTVDPGPPWIRIDDHKSGEPSEGCVIRNNLTTAVVAGAGVVEDHNIIVSMGSLGDHFLDAAGGDLHLVPTSEAVDSGSADLAPVRDRDEVFRPQGAAVDVGAYEWYSGEPYEPTEDADGDGVADEVDNCPQTPNPLQEDLDNDGLGDACDSPGPDGGGADGSVDGDGGVGPSGPGGGCSCTAQPQGSRPGGGVPTGMLLGLLLGLGLCGGRSKAGWRRREGGRAR